MRQEDEVEDIIAALELEPHPEGGLFRETYRHRSPDGGRGAGTAIYYMLRAGERSHWHRVDADEMWHWYAGARLCLRICQASPDPDDHILGPDILTGERPQVLVPKSAWQSAESLGAWTLVGCTVAPAFEYSGFELAAPGWSPGDG
jgi:predicted cupin superfamily sugar epimerase